MFKKLFILSALLGSTSAFVPAAKPAAVKAPTTSLNIFSESTFNDAVKDWEAEYPQFAKYGWGPSVHAEIWNGRHAMAGFVVLCATAYAKGHGLIPNADQALDFKEWGVLATISGKTTITNERAIILIANVHLLFMSLCATLAPNGFSDPLMLDEATMAGEPGYERAVKRNAEPFGVMPKMNMGLTNEAELMNGRMAMLGLCAVFAASGIEGKPMLDIINEWVGGAYY